MAVLAIGWVWPVAVGADVCLHLAAEHATEERVAAGAMLVLHGHAHVHGVAAHDHGLAVGVGAPTAVRPGWSVAGPDIPAATPKPGPAPEGASHAGPVRGSPPPLHLLLCTFLT